MSMRSPKRRLWLGAVLLFTAFLSACSALQFSYNNADGLVRYMAWDYLGLDAHQAEEFQRRFATLQAWHRSSELPEYVKFMRAVDARLGKGVTSTDLEWALESIRTRYAVVMRRALRDAAPVLVTLTPRQLQVLERKFTRENAKYVEQWLSGTEKTRYSRRVDRVSERIEDWTGKLNPAQRKRVEAFVSAYPGGYEVRLEDRRRWQREVLSILRSGQNAEEIGAAMGRLLAEPERMRADEMNREMRIWETGLIEMLLDIVATLSDSQRDRLRNRIGRYAEDFHELSKVSASSVR